MDAAKEHAKNKKPPTPSGMREYLTGRSDGMKGAHLPETERGEPHTTREDTTATEHRNHKPEGTKRASGMPTHASMHEQGMAGEREPKPPPRTPRG